MTEPADLLIGQLAAANPATLRLAEALSLATLVDKALLRAMRIGLKGMGPEAEADLYFSEIVQDRSTAGFTLHQEAAAILRRRLLQQPEHLMNAWDIVSKRHPTIPPAMQTEECLQWHALNGEMDRVREILRDCIAALVDPARPGFAAWAVDAIDRLDPAIRVLDEYRMLGIGAALRTGASEHRIAELADDRLDSWLSWLAPQTKAKRKVGVTLIEGGIEFGPPVDRRYSDVIEVPTGSSTLLTITKPSGLIEFVTLRHDERRAVKTFATNLVVGTADGGRWQLTSVRAQRFIKENRAPRVHIEYEVETYGSRQKVILPFVMGVMTDLSGHSHVEKTTLENRAFVEFDLDNFEQRMAAIAPRAVFSVANTLTGDGKLNIDLSFLKMDQFSPGEIVKQVPELAKLFEARQQLNDLMIYMDGKDGAQNLLSNFLSDPALIKALAAVKTVDGGDGAKEKTQSISDQQFGVEDDRIGEEAIQANYNPPMETRSLDEFSNLLKKEFKPNDEMLANRIEQAVQTLAQQALSDTNVVSNDLFSTMDSMRDALDKQLSDQVNQIIHHLEFQKMESAWRGLHYLVLNTATGSDLKIRVINMAKEECRKVFRAYNGRAWDQSPLFKQIYESEFGQLGGEPYGAFVCDYAFDHSPQDLEVLKGLAKIGATAHAPFLSSAAPGLLGMESWQELSNPRDIGQLFDASDYMAWRGFRASNASRYIALTVPRFLGRMTYGAKSDPVEEFDFEEVTNGEHDKYLWVNSAYAMGVRITEAFSTWGWCTRIRGVEGGGTVENLPIAYFPADVGGADIKCATEISISDRREADLSRAGLLPLVHRQNTDEAFFIGAQTCYQPKAYEDPAASANENLAARLPYIFACSRFVHYIKCMVRDWIGSARDPSQLQRDLSQWIFQYIDASPESSIEETKARLPLKDASIEVVPDPVHAGRLTCKLLVVPHYQLEGMDVALTVTFELPFEN